MAGLVSSAVSSDTLRGTAERIVAKMKRIYGPPVFARASESEFGHLDLDVYRSFKDTLQSRGYRFLSDFKVVGLTDAPDSPMVPTMVRSMVSADGTTSASHYQATPRMNRRVTTLFVGVLSLRFIIQPRRFLQSLMTKHCDEFTSEVAGTFIVTTNAEGAQAISSPKAIDTKYFAYGTPVEEVRAVHEARLKAAIKRAGATPMSIKTIEDVFALEKRLKECTNAHRATLHWVTQNELRASAHGNTALADAIFKEVQAVLAESSGSQRPASAESAPSGQTRPRSSVAARAFLVVWGFALVIFMQSWWRWPLVHPARNDYLIVLAIAAVGVFAFVLLRQGLGFNAKLRLANLAMWFAVAAGGTGGALLLANAVLDPGPTREITTLVVGEYCGGRRPDIAVRPAPGSPVAAGTMHVTVGRSICRATRDGDSVVVMIGPGYFGRAWVQAARPVQVARQ